eukprot:jgi/Chlat1/8543/Chrsp82S07943
MGRGRPPSGAAAVVLVALLTACASTLQLVSALPAQGSRLSSSLRHEHELHQQRHALLLEDRGAQQQQGAAIPAPTPHTSTHKVPFHPPHLGIALLTLLATNGTEALLLEIEELELGFVPTGSRGQTVVSGWMPAGRMSELEKVGQLRHADISRAVPRGRRRLMDASSTVEKGGRVISQGVKALGVDVVRSIYGVTGSGVKVGVISDSFDIHGGYQTDVENGELPARVTVLKEFEGLGFPDGANLEDFVIDEGRAMLQIIHDIAPDADLYFHTGFEGLPQFETAVTALVAQGVNIIIDDLFYLNEPYLSDGTLSDVIRAAKTAGVSYFTSAGNDGMQSYVGAMVAKPVGQFSLHRFSVQEGPYQRIRVCGQCTITLVLQWDDQFETNSGKPTSTDLDLYLLKGPQPNINNANTIVTDSTDDNIASGEPVEKLAAFCNLPLGAYCTNYIAISLSHGPSPKAVKYLLHFTLPADAGLLGDPSLLTAAPVDKINFDKGTVLGHANCEAATAVGAMYWKDTPAYNNNNNNNANNSNQPSFYSSGGGVGVLIDSAGKRYNKPAVRRKPLFVAPDGVSVDVDTFPTGFFGTSAAAPHAGRCYIARPDLPPDKLIGLMAYHATKVQPDDKFDFRCGYGVLNALSSFQAAVDSDKDGRVDAVDACQGTKAGDAVDNAGCSIKQLCPCDHMKAGPCWTNHLAYVKCVTDTAAAFRASHSITAKYTAGNCGGCRQFLHLWQHQTLQGAAQLTGQLVVIATADNVNDPEAEVVDQSAEALADICDAGSSDICVILSRSFVVSDASQGPHRKLLGDKKKKSNGCGKRRRSLLAVENADANGDDIEERTTSSLTTRLRPYLNLTSIKQRHRKLVDTVNLLQLEFDFQITVPAEDVFTVQAKLLGANENNGFYQTLIATLAYKGFYVLAASVEVEGFEYYPDWSLPRSKGAWEVLPPTVPTGPMWSYAGSQVGDSNFVFAGGLPNAKVCMTYNAITSAFTTCADMPIGVVSASSVFFSGKVHVTGGLVFNTSTPTTKVQRYDFQAKTWSTSFPSLQVPRHGHATFVFRDQLCVVGGTSEAYASSPVMAPTDVVARDGPFSNLAITPSLPMECYVDGRWNVMYTPDESLASIPFVLGAYTPTLSVYSTLYFFTANADSSDAYILTEQTYSDWGGVDFTTIPTMPTKRRGAGVTVLDDGSGLFLVVVGGMDITTGAPSSVAEIYQPYTDFWATISPMNVPRAYMSLFTSAKAILAFSGLRTPTVESLVPVPLFPYNNNPSPAPPQPNCTYQSGIVWSTMRVTSPGVLTLLSSSFGTTPPQCCDVCTSYLNCVAWDFRIQTSGNTRTPTCKIYTELYTPFQSSRISDATGSAGIKLVRTQPPLPVPSRTRPNGYTCDLIENDTLFTIQGGDVLFTDVAPNPRSCCDMCRTMPGCQYWDMRFNATGAPPTYCNLYTRALNLTSPRIPRISNGVTSLFNFTSGRTQLCAGWPSTACLV